MPYEHVTASVRLLGRALGGGLDLGVIALFGWGGRGVAKTGGRRSLLGPPYTQKVEGGASLK